MSVGLGPYIAASCAEDIGGRLWLERSDARGSEFCVQIRSLDDELAAPEAEHSAGSAMTATASG